MVAIIERNTQQDTNALPNPLTAREQEILHTLGQEYTTTEIAEQLFISSGTVRNYVKSIYRKLEVNNRVTAMERARALNLI